MSTTLTTTTPRPLEVPTIPGPGATNTVLADIQEAVETYPQTHLTVEIYNVNPPGGAINENEDVTFSVRVANGGPLHVNGLTVLIEGLNGTTVKQHSDTTFRSSITSGVFDRVSAHQASVPTDSPDGHYHFKVGGARPLGQLLRVSVKDWNAAVFDHLFDAHSDPSPSTNDVYSAQVLDA